MKRGFPQTRQPDPLDTLLFRSAVVEVGAFRVDPGHPRFADSGPIQRHIVVFPRTFVRIAHEGEEGFLAGPDLVTYYNRGQVYRRESVRDQPDRCEWFAFSPDVLAGALLRWDPAARERPDHPFAFSHGRSDAVSYARQRRVVESLRAGGRPDPLAVEEEMVGVLARLLATAYGCGGRFPGRSAAADRRDRDLAEGARALLSASYRRAQSLADLATALRVSVYRLCRVFRRQTGTTLHAFRNRLRLTASLEILPRAEGGLTALALELGYCSHSHFTAAFRREFGVPPSSYRSAMTAPVTPFSSAARRPAS